MQEAKASAELERALAAEAALVAARRDVEQLTAQIEDLHAREAAQQARLLPPCYALLGLCKWPSTSLCKREATCRCWHV